VQFCVPGAAKCSSDVCDSDFSKTVLTRFRRNENQQYLLSAFLTYCYLQLPNFITFLIEISLKFIYTAWSQEINL